METAAPPPAPRAAPAPGAPITPALRDRVLARLGLDAPPAPDLAGLRAVYAAWCARVPFDNVRKMIALRTPAGAAAPLPGSHADDFLEAWLAHGAGGTCWPSSTGLFALLESLGFPARRVAGSMRDLGIPNHASIKVALDGRDWLVDSSILTREPLPLGDAAATVGEAPYDVEVEPADGAHVVWFASPPYAFFPCRLVLDPADAAFYLDAYERSRAASPFNGRLSARRHRPGEQLSLRGPLLVRRTAAGTVEERTLDGDALCAALRDEIGISAELVEAWAACGALADTLAPFAGPPPPPFTTVPPSRRGARGAAD